MPKTSGLQQLKLTADAFDLELSGDSWFELMHWHPDMHGLGNADEEARIFCLQLAKQYLSKVMRALNSWPKPSQCWCLIDPSDSAQDSIYAHTENPNRPNFPYDFKNVRWDVTAPLWIGEVFSEAEYRIGISGTQTAHLYWIIERSQGSKAGL